MSYEFWVASEKFLYDSFFINLIILGIIFFIILHRLTYMGETYSKTSNIIYSIIVIFFIVFGVNTVVKFNKHKVLYSYNTHVNYGIRDNKKTVFTYHYPGHWEKNLYSNLYLADNFRSVGIYDEEIVTEDVEFLGRDGDNFYFQDKDQIISRRLGDYLEIVDDISSPIREGAKYCLKDSQFKDIGFKEKSPHTYLLGYRIPKSEANKEFKNPENMITVQEKEFTSAWLNPTSKNKP